MRLIYQSKWGGTLNLTDNPYFYLTNVDGMTAATESLSSVVIGGVDGDIVNNAQAQPRGIIMDFRIKSGVNVEDAKRAILEIIKLKQKGTLLWTQNGRTLTIQGIVAAVVMPRFNNAVTMQVTLHCEQPFWEDLNEIITEINEIKNLHYFTDDPHDMLYFPEEGIPFGVYDPARTQTFYNAGDVAVGVIIEILAYKTVTNPILYFADGFFGVGYAEKPLVMSAGDVLRIDTKVGEKSVTLNDVNVFNYIKPRSTWLELEAGENEITINSDDTEIDNMVFNLFYKQRYV